MQVTGDPMFRVWCKLKSLKGPLKSLIHHYSHVDFKIETTRGLIDSIQTSFQSDPLNSQLFSSLVDAQRGYDHWMLIEENILK